MLNKKDIYIFSFVLFLSHVLSIERSDLYDTSWALLIGIDKYETVTPNLNYAVDDAEDMATLLVDQFGFPDKNVTLLKNEQATKQNILKSFRDITKSAKKNDRVLIFFAGHGETYKLPEGGEMGYLLPYDSDTEDLYYTSIPMNEFKTLSTMSESKHLLFLIDACYGGLASVGTRGLDVKTPNYIDKISQDKSRQVITAGGRGEKAIEKSEWGHSAFTMNLLRALKNGRADYNSDGIITTNELYMFLKEKVTQDSEHAQTPQTGRYSTHEGEFVFVYSENTTINQSSPKLEQSSEDLQLILKKLEALEAATQTIVIENEDGEEVEEIVPREDYLKTVSLFPVTNNIENDNYNWISTGLYQGVSCVLSQYILLDMATNRVVVKIHEEGYKDKFESVPFYLKRKIAKSVNSEYFLDIDVSLNKDNEFIASATLYKTKNQAIQETYTVISDDIFKLIDQVSSHIVDYLKIPATNDIRTSKDILTESIQAYESYSRGAREMIMGDFEAASLFFKKATEFDETFAMAYLTIQGAYFLSNQGDKGVEVLKKTMQYIDRLPERFHYIAKVSYFRLRGQPERANRVMENHLKQFPRDLDGIQLNIQLQMSGGDFEGLLESYSKILEIDPSRYDIYLEIGNAYRRFLDNNEKAIEAYNKYVEYFPNDSKGYHSLSKAYGKLGDKDKQRDNLDMTTILDPTNIEAELELISLDYDGTEQIEKHRNLLSDCNSPSDSIQVYDKIENELREYGMYTEAIKTWKKTEKMKKTHENFMDYAIENIFMATQYAMIGRTDESLALLKQYQETYETPFNSIVNIGYIDVYNILKDPEKMQEYFDAAIDEFSRIGNLVLIDVFILENALDVQLEILKGNYLDAIVLVEENRRKDWDKMQALLSKAYRLNGELGESKAVIEKMCDDGDYCSVDAQYEAALVYYDLGDYTKSRKYLEGYLNHFKHADPEFISLIEAKKTLEKLNQKEN